MRPLAGYTVGVTAARRRAELGAALERQGARVMYGPAIQLVPLADDATLRAATERCVEAPPDLVVVTTGVGFRGWADAADSWALAERLRATLGQATILTRGPKARGAIRAYGLREAWSPESESTDGMLDHLRSAYDLHGMRVAVQLHGEPLDDLLNALRNAGADVIEVPVYRSAMPADREPLDRLVEAVVSGQVDALTFTSAPAVTNFLLASDELGRADAVRAALRGPVLCVAVGPVCAVPLEKAEIPVRYPDRHRLGALVREVAEQLPRRARDQF
jgi:uroporphyrinogen-III synthase